MINQVLFTIAHICTLNAFPILLANRFLCCNLILWASFIRSLKCHSEGKGYAIPYREECKSEDDCCGNKIPPPFCQSVYPKTPYQSRYSGCRDLRLSYKRPWSGKIIRGAVAIKSLQLRACAATVTIASVLIHQKKNLKEKSLLYHVSHLTSI